MITPRQWGQRNGHDEVSETGLVNNPDFGEPKKKGAPKPRLLHGRSPERMTEQHLARRSRSGSAQDQALLLSFGFWRFPWKQILTLMRHQIVFMTACGRVDWFPLKLCRFDDQKDRRCGRVDCIAREGAASTFFASVPAPCAVLSRFRSVATSVSGSLKNPSRGSPLYNCLDQSSSPYRFLVFPFFRVADHFHHAFKGRTALRKAIAEGRRFCSP